jgi:hypothetical protein
VFSTIDLILSGNQQLLTELQKQNPTPNQPFGAVFKEKVIHLFVNWLISSTTSNFTTCFVTTKVELSKHSIVFQNHPLR